MERRLKIKELGLEAGFDLVGVTTADSVDIGHRQYFDRWLSAGCAAGMSYMHNHIDKRFNPSKLLKGAKSVICAAVMYNTPSLPSSAGRIASFARFEDYHIIMKDMLWRLASLIQAQSPLDIGFKACVDSVPIAERSLAHRAGLGFIGRSRLLINPELGGRLLLGELITTLEIEPDAPLDHPGCGDCRECIAACPNGALERDGHFDARKCVSYLTVEHKDSFDPQSEVNLNNCIYGCDACLDACPYNQRPASPNPNLRFHPEWTELTRQRILDMTESEFAVHFAGSGLIRLGLERLKRNCLALRP